MATKYDEVLALLQVVELSAKDSRLHPITSLAMVDLKKAVKEAQEALDKMAKEEAEEAAAKAAEEAAKKKAAEPKEEAA